MEDGNFPALRKRMGRARERSVDPGTRTRAIAVVDDTALLDEWDLFKESIYDKYPSIKFPEEYCDMDVITASVSGIDTNLVSVINSVPENVKFNVQQDGRIVIEFRKAEPVPEQIKFPVKYRLLAFWIICAICFVAFVILNLGKYKKLLWI